MVDDFEVLFYLSSIIAFFIGCSMLFFGESKILFILGLLFMILMLISGFNGGKRKYQSKNKK